MKQTLLLFAALPFFLFAQNEKGAAPLAPSNVKPQTSNATRAVVVGISDYQSPQIPDLQFADRDAQAFAAWLRSPAGGSVPGADLRVLTNREANTARLAEALDWLAEESQENDLAIIYFSGYADVERISGREPGFLLAWDAPPANYKAGAYPIFYLQDVVATISVAKKARVVVIADACRAGRLVGNSIGGAQIALASLSRQMANETKILSCQPNEFSLEDEQWGGGRSAFSYRLIEGLYGLADQDRDGQVTLYEIGKYLENTVPADVAPQQQTPMAMGNLQTVLALTDPDLTAVLRFRHVASPPGALCAPCERFYQRLETALRDQTGAFDWLTRQPDLTPFGEDDRVKSSLLKYGPAEGRR